MDIKTLRHSISHVLAQAVKHLYPKIKLGIGPATEDGFYYDFDTNVPFTPEDLIKIENEMKKLISQDQKFEKKEITKQQAKKLFKDEKYKLELIKDLKGKITSYTNGDFTDLCSGPHIKSTKEIKAFKLLRVAGAYWKGDSKNKMLQRIYGTAFETEKELKDYLHMIEEAEKRDHRKIGKKLDLFSFHEEAPGFPFFHPNGITIWNALLEFWREEHKKAGYVEVKTPMILSKELWLQSGHWDHYKENMYFTKIDNKEFAIKPMNCPGGMLLYKEKMHSYKEFPLRVAEVGLVHRHELSGVLAGLFRVRCFHQDDAHIFMTDSQMKDEIINVFNLIDKFYKTFGFEYHVELSTRPEKAMGNKKVWDLAEKTLEDAMKIKKVNYKINKGDGAFYGPKLDFHIKDSLGRTWQCATIQLDFQMPERFDLTYESPDGKKHRPVMIHRVIYGSIERFIGVLTEHYAGKFPLWLTPTQVKIITVTDRNVKYAEELKKELEKNNIRVDLDSRAESISKKIRDAHEELPYYVITIGDREEQSNVLAVRTRDNKVINFKKEELIKDILEKIKTRSLQ